MKLYVQAAHRRADCALLFATALIFAGVTASAAVDLYTDQQGSVPVIQAALEPVVVTKPQIVLARAGAPSEGACLAEAMYYEARGEGLAGQKAVAEVVMDRLHDLGFPKTICAVVHEGAKLHTGCQFSFVCDGSLDRPKNLGSWRHIRQLATAIVGGAIRLSNETGQATHFHAIDVQPAWAGGLIRTAQIGNHIFYRRDTGHGS